jgi:hypothetical protein
LNRARRLQAAEKWLQKYTGNNIVRGYSKHFGVNLLCAASELQALGYEVIETYIQQLKADERRREALALQRKRKREEQESAYLLDEDDFVYYSDPFNCIDFTPLTTSSNSSYSDDDIPF